MMNIDDIRASLSLDDPQGNWLPLLQAMWWDAKGDWHRAHEIAQDIKSETGSLVHAYLHRKEGDIGNAGYWYRRAGRSVFTGSLEREWEAIVAELTGEV